MSVGVEALFTSALGLKSPWEVEVPWARPGSGFTLLFDAFALSLCQSMPVAHATTLLRVNAKQLWRRIAHYVGVARAQETMDGVAVVGIDDLSFRRGQDYVTLVHDLETKRLLFMTEGRKHGTVIEFKADLIAHGGDPADIKHVCMDMSAAYTKGVTEAFPQAQINFDRFHVIALGNEAMDKVRREEMLERPRAVRAALGTERKAVRGMVWGMRKDAADWTGEQMNTMYRLQRSNLKSARAWRLKEGLRAAYTIGVSNNCPDQAEAALKSWISWARRSRLEPFKKLGATLRDRLAGVVRGMLDGRSNAYVEAMNGMLQQTKRAARISHREELRRHRLPSHVQVEKPAAESHATRCAAAIYHLPCWPSISTKNGIEPKTGRSRDAAAWRSTWRRADGRHSWN